MPLTPIRIILLLVITILKLSDKLPHISIVGPANNEAGNIAPFVEECIKGLKDINCSFEIILIDDGSDDETSINMDKIKKKIS